MRVIGIEAANSFVKIKSDKGESVYLNTVREHFEWEEAVIDDLGKEDLRFKYDGKIYSVGAINEYDSSSSRDNDKYGKEQYKLENLLGIAQHVENGDEVIVVTGLPSVHYTKANQKVVRDGLKGTHTVYVGNEPRTFEIKDVKVILQPLGTLMHLILKSDGSPRSESSGMLDKSKRSLIIDIGWGTTDVAIMEGVQLKDYFGIDTAMLEAYEAILQRLKLRSKVTPFKAEHQSRNYKEISYGGVTHDVSEIQEEVFERIADSIIAKVKNRESFEPYDMVVFTGGGVSALREHIQSVALDIPNAKQVKDPQLANARGYYSFGVYKSN